MSRALAGGGLLLLLALAALVGGPTGLLLVHACLLCLVLATWLAGTESTGAGSLPEGAPRLAFAAFVLLFVIGFARAPYGYAAWLTLLELAAFSAVVWLASRSGPTLLQRLATPSALLVCAVSLFVLYNAGSGGPQSMLGFVNPNHLAGWLVALSLVVASALAGRWAGGARRRWLVGAALVLTVASALAVTGSRGAFVGLVAGLVTLFALRARRMTRRTRRALLAVGALVLLLAGAGLVERVRHPDAFSYQRTKIWAASLRMIADRPWWGVGPRQFAAAAGNYQFPDGHGPLRFDRRFSRTHSDLLRVPAEFGLPAGLALLAALLLGLRAAGRARADPAARGLRAGAAAGLAALAAQCSVENLSETPAVYLLGAVLLGSLMSTARTTPRARPLPLRIALALLLLVIFSVGDLAPYLAWREIETLPRGRLDAAGRQRLDRAIRLNPLQPDYRRRLAEHIYGAGDDWSPALYAEAREAAEQAVRLDPSGAPFRLGVARVEAEACRSLFTGSRATALRAAAAYDRAAALDRSNGLIRLEQAGALLDCDAPDLAASAAEQALELEPESVAPRLLLAGALLDGQPGDTGRARELLAGAEELARRHRDWPRQGPYAARLLALDPRLVERLRLAADSVDVAETP